MFWITGKPGSGKSTLMKYVAESTRTRDLLPAHLDRQWLVVHFYFDFRAGSGIANSVDGLLKSILFQLARQSDDAADAIRHDPKGADYHEVRSNLDRQELLHLLQVSTSAILPKHDVCGFIDGLDEFSGHSLDLLRLMDSLIHHGVSKICVASRPEFILAQYLGDRPHLEMQAYNFRTIHAYVKDVLQQIPAQVHPNVSLAELTKDVVQATEGVILWARLAMYHLVQSVISGETKEEIYQALNEFPRELNGVYERLLQALEPSKQLESAMFLHLIQNGTPNTTMWDLHCAMVFLGGSNMLPFWPKQALSCDSFALRLRSRTGSMVDIVYANSSVGIGDGSRRKKPQLFHKTLDTYLSTTGWARRTLMQAEPSIQPDDMWLQMCSSCLRQNELSEVTFSRIFSSCDLRHYLLPVDFSRYLQPTMFEDEKVFSVLTQRNTMASATGFLDHALTMYPYYLRQTVQYRTKPLDDCHRWIMGSKLMVLHHWLAGMPGRATGCDCDYLYFQGILYSWSNLATLGLAQRAAILAQAHRMDRQSTDWLYAEPGLTDHILAKEMLKVFINVSRRLTDFDEANDPDFFALLRAFSGLACSIDDSDLLTAVYSEYRMLTWVTNMILLTVFKARSSIEHNQLRWIPRDLLPDYIGELGLRGCNLLGLWVFATCQGFSRSRWSGVEREQLTILLSSGLDINESCTELGPPLHTMLAIEASNATGGYPVKIQCLLDNGADATILGPHGTPLEMARSNLRRWGNVTSRDYINNTEIVRLLEEHVYLITKRQHAL